MHCQTAVVAIYDYRLWGSCAPELIPSSHTIRTKYGNSRVRTDIIGQCLQSLLTSACSVSALLQMSIYNTTLKHTMCIQCMSVWVVIHAEMWGWQATQNTVAHNKAACIAMIMQCVVEWRRCLQSLTHIHQIIDSGLGELPLWSCLSFAFSKLYLDVLKGTVYRTFILLWAKHRYKLECSPIPAWLLMSDPFLVAPYSYGAQNNGSMCKLIVIYIPI